MASRNDLSGDVIPFLHRMNVREDSATFVDAALADIRQAAFLDGRKSFWQGERWAVLSKIVGAAQQRPPVPGRFMFHTSFCGSTFLARLLDIPGHSIALKEPHCLVDLADQAAAVKARSPGLLDDMIRFAVTRLSEVGEAEGCKAIIKPSNWANNLIGELTAAAAIETAIFVSIDQSAFIQAVFRGGRDRMAFTARAAAHLARSTPGGNSLLEEAIAGADAPIDKMARICAFVHALQERLFAGAMTAHGWGHEHWIDHELIAADPRQALVQAAQALGIPLSGDHIDSALRRHSGWDAKAPERSFSAERRAAENIAIYGLYGTSIEKALTWAETVCSALG